MVKNVHFNLNLGIEHSYEYVEIRDSLTLQLSASSLEPKNPNQEKSICQNKFINLAS